MAFENDPEGYWMAQCYAGADFDKPRKTCVEVFRESDSLEWTVSDFLKDIAEAVDLIPAHELDSATVSLVGGYDESKSLSISYLGTETTVVVDARVKICEDYVKKCREKERSEFERLRAKFG